MIESIVIQTLQKTIESQNEIIEFLRKEIQRANENVEFLLKKLYGRKTEKTSTIDGQLVIKEVALGLFNEAEIKKMMELIYTRSIIYLNNLSLFLIIL